MENSEILEILREMRAKMMTVMTVDKFDGAIEKLDLKGFRKEVPVKLAPTSCPENSVVKEQKQSEGSPGFGEIGTCSREEQKQCREESTSANNGGYDEDKNESSVKNEKERISGGTVSVVGSTDTSISNTSRKVEETSVVGAVCGIKERGERGSDGGVSMNASEIKESAAPSSEDSSVGSCSDNVKEDIETFPTEAFSEADPELIVEQLETLPPAPLCVDDLSAHDPLAVTQVRIGPENPLESMVLNAADTSRNKDATVPPSLLPGPVAAMKINPAMQNIPERPLALGGNRNTSKRKAQVGARFIIGAKTASRWAPPIDGGRSAASTAQEDPEKGTKGLVDIPKAEHSAKWSSDVASPSAKTFKRSASFSDVRAKGEGSIAPSVQNSPEVHKNRRKRPKKVAESPKERKSLLGVKSQRKVARNLRKNAVVVRSNKNASLSPAVSISGESVLKSTGHSKALPGVKRTNINLGNAYKARRKVQRKRRPAPSIYVLWVSLLLVLIRFSLMTDGLAMLLRAFTGHKLMVVWTDGLKIHQPYTVACSLYVWWFTVRLRSLLSNWQLKGRGATMVKVNEKIFVTSKTIVAKDFVLGRISAHMILLFHVGIAVPLQVPIDHTPVLYIWQEWALGVLHTWVIWVLALMGPNWWLKWGIQQDYHSGRRNMGLRFLFADFRGNECMIPQREVVLADEGHWQKHEKGLTGLRVNAMWPIGATPATLVKSKKVPALEHRQN